MRTGGLVILSGAALSDAATTCTGSSAKLAQAECDAWGDFYDDAGGTGWTTCSAARTDPCSCKGTTDKNPVCTPDGTSVVTIVLGSNNMKGTLSKSIAAWTNIDYFDINSNMLGGEFTADASKWTKITWLNIRGNQIKGPLPAIPFGPHTTGCYVLDAKPTNSFTCPWPKNAVHYCQKGNTTNPKDPDAGYVPITDADCTKATPTPPPTPTPKPAEPTPKPAPKPTPKPAEPTPKPAEPTPKPANPTPKPPANPTPPPPANPTPPPPPAPTPAPSGSSHTGAIIGGVLGAAFVGGLIFRGKKKNTDGEWSDKKQALMSTAVSFD